MKKKKQKFKSNTLVLDEPIVRNLVHAGLVTSGIGKPGWHTVKTKEYKRTPKHPHKDE